MSETLLTILKWCVLALLYLFFLRVLWAVWSEVRTARAVPVAPDLEVREPHQAAPPKGRRTEPIDTPARRFVITDPPARAGSAYDLNLLGPEITVGRAPGCAVTLPDDSFVSHLHARVYVRDGDTWVEDLGSTNGTWLNGTRVDAPTLVRPGDRLQVGNTVLEAA